MKPKKTSKEVTEDNPVPRKQHKNKFNKLTSKEWLPFQKSWFKYDGKEKLYRESVRFFTAAPELGVVYYDGDEKKVIETITKAEGLQLTTTKTQKDQNIQFAVIDLINKITATTSLAQYKTLKGGILDQIKRIIPLLVERRFLVVFIPNIQKENTYFPFAWDLAKEISTVLSLKDEKIACIESDVAHGNPTPYFYPIKNHFYCLYFRKDEFSGELPGGKGSNFFEKNEQQESKQIIDNTIPSWFILKPQPRKKNEILHPAKYPEALVEMFIETFTNVGDNVLDPMSGTGSTQMAALKKGRNGYGTELSDFFSTIANDRCTEYITPSQSDIFSAPKSEKFLILNKDARSISKKDFPPIDYIITSPPYWDMLNMKGAENQAKRLEKGLQTNYSESDKDFGNISDYQEFLKGLCDIYFSLVSIMKKGSYLTIVVKNIKKKGRNYPFAWDLANTLQKELILLPEVFWCQDDISIAPYGYGNTWVSNTFHQYCLTFQKPFKKK